MAKNPKPVKCTVRPGYTYRDADGDKHEGGSNEVIEVPANHLDVFPEALTKYTAPPKQAPKDEGEQGNESKNTGAQGK